MNLIASTSNLRGLVNYWPINNDDLKDYTGSSDLIPNNNVIFTSDRFDQPNQAIFLNDSYSYFTVKSDIYFDSGIYKYRFH